MSAVSQRLADELVLVGKDAELRITQNISRAELNISMDEAPTVTIDVEDYPDYFVLRDSGVLGQKFFQTTMLLRGVSFTLSEITKTETGETLVFYASAVAQLKRVSVLSKAPRSRLTRAQFVGGLCQRAGVDFASPDANARQQIAPVSAQDQKALRDSRQSATDLGRKKGSSARGSLTGKGIRVKNAAATRDQLRNIEVCMARADREGAKPRAIKAMIVAAIGESEFKAVKNPTSVYSGVFQADPKNIPASDTDEQARSFLRGGKGFQNGGAIAYARNVPNATPGQIAYLVEGDRSNFSSDQAAAQFYDKWGSEADKIMEAWSPGSGDSSVDDQSGRTGTPDRAFVNQYEFRVERGENWWATIQRLADEVGWRAFVAGATVWFASDLTLARATPAFVFSEQSDGVDRILWSRSQGGRLDEMTIQGRMNVDAGEVGQVVAVDGEGAPVDKERWLIRSIRRDLLDTLGGVEITLSLPQKPKPEPASTVTTIAGADPSGSQTGTATPGGLRDKIVAEARKSLSSKTGFNRYSQAGAVTTDPTPATARTDCSQWIYAIYHRAGAGNPGTYTGDMYRIGKPTSKPKPGDIVLYGAPPGHHVELYIGGGRTIGHGSPPIDYGKPDLFGDGNYHYFTYGFLDG